MFNYLTYGSDFLGSTLVDLFKTVVILSLSSVKFTTKNSPTIMKSKPPYIAGKKYPTGFI